MTHLRDGVRTGEVGEAAPTTAARAEAAVKEAARFTKGTVFAAGGAGASRDADARTETVVPTARTRSDMTKRKPIQRGNPGPDARHEEAQARERRETREECAGETRRVAM